MLAIERNKFPFSPPSPPFTNIPTYSTFFPIIWHLVAQDVLFSAKCYTVVLKLTFRYIKYIFSDILVGIFGLTKLTRLTWRHALTLLQPVSLHPAPRSSRMWLLITYIGYLPTTTTDNIYKQLKTSENGSVFMVTECLAL